MKLLIAILAGFGAFVALAIGGTVLTALIPATWVERVALFDLLAGVMLIRGFFVGAGFVTGLVVARWVWRNAGAAVAPVREHGATPGASSPAPVATAVAPAATHPSDELSTRAAVAIWGTVIAFPALVVGVPALMNTFGS